MEDKSVEAAVNKKKHSLFLWYTIFFAVAAVLCFSYFAIYQKSFIWKNDGLYQHYNAFLYVGKQIRSFIRGVISDGNFSFSMWEWGFGGGADVISNQILYDPFYLLSVFFPTRFAEFGYGFTVVLRLYLVGFTFCLYCRKMNCAKWTTVFASIAYTFCAFSLYAGPRHPYFLNAMYVTPLIFLGCEKIFRKESFVLFSLTVALAAFFDFYFFYMVVIFTVLYVFVRIIFTPEYRNCKFLATNVGKLFAFALIGIMISCILFLPTVMSFFSNDTRISDTYTYDPLYSLTQYSRIPGNFVSATEEATNWLVVGMSPVAYIGVFGSFANRDKKQRWARILFLAELAFILLPFFGSMFNGFGYVTNRWVFFWPFIPAYLFAKEFPDILKLSTQKKLFLCIGCIGYTVLCLFIEKSHTEASLSGLVLLLIALVITIFSSELKSLRGFRIFKKNVSAHRIVQATSIALILASVFNIAYYRYSDTQKDYLSEFRDAGSANDILENELASTWKLIHDKEFYRTDVSAVDLDQANFPFYLHQPTTTSYWSLNSKESIEWRQINNDYDANNFRFTGICSRAWLGAQYSAKYFTASNDPSILFTVPYGYEYQGTAEGRSGEYCLYKTDNYLPFGSTYESVMSRSDFENLSIAERQQAALQSCVVDDVSSSALASVEPEYSDYEIDYQLEYGKDVSADENNVLHVKKDNSTITLNFNGNTKGELYVQFTGLRYTKGKSNTRIIAESEYNEARVFYYTEKNLYSEGRTEYLLNLGYSEEERNSIDIKFSNKGDYSFDSLKIICQPMEKLPEYVEARSRNAMENIEFTNNRITGTIDLDKPMFLCMSLPYSEGWTAYVDGEKADLLNANIAFSGLELDAGHHEIELKFCTPYLKSGVVLSVLGIAALIGLCILFRHKDSILNKFRPAKEKTKPTEGE